MRPIHFQTQSLCKFVCMGLLMIGCGASQCVSAASAGSMSQDVPTWQFLSNQFSESVHPVLMVPDAVSDEYVVTLDNALQEGNFQFSNPEFVVLVDRNPYVQAILIYLGTPQEGWHLIGATPVSTGLPGKFEHFLTPVGVFTHSLNNLDFRAEGTKNELGFRGYGIKGMRVFDFGWAPERRTWGKKDMGVLRLQMHATDPELAEHLLGMPRSEGCIRIPATLNYFIDHNGILDAQYEEALADGAHFWVLSKDRVSTPFSGRYLVVVDSDVSVKPLWSEAPNQKSK